MTEEQMKARIAELEQEVTDAKAGKSAALGEKNKAKQDLKTLEDRISELEGERDDAKNAGKSELERAQDKVKSLTAEVAAFKIDAVINEAITSHKVMAEDADLVRTFLKAGVTMNDKGAAMAGDKTLADHITGFFASDVAKRYVAAPANTGAGATGSASKITTPNKMPETAEEWNSFYKSVEGKPEEANAALKSWGL